MIPQKLNLKARSLHIMADKIYLITGNPDKLKSAEKAFEDKNLELSRIENAEPEIQGSSSLKVARHQVEQALKGLDYPVIREDHSLYLDAIPGFPGPYLSYFDNSIPAEKLLDIIEGEERTGYFEIATVLGLPNGEIKEYEFKVPVKIAKELSGDERNWDRVLMLKESDKTFAESETGSRLEIWNRNFRKISEEMSESESK